MVFFIPFPFKYEFDSSGSELWLQRKEGWDQYEVKAMERVIMQFAL